MMIETARLLIRPLRWDDLDALSALLTDRETLTFWPRPYTPEEAAAWLARSVASHAESGLGRCAVVLKADGRFIGDAGVVPDKVIDGETVADLGYILQRRVWGRGLASEAAMALRDWAFAKGLPSLHATMPTAHRASQRVAEKLGMTRRRSFANPANRGEETWLYGLDTPRLSASFGTVSGPGSA